MRRLSACLMVVLLAVTQGGCLWYHGERKWGDYYSTTKTVWDEPFARPVEWFWLGDWGSVGQTISSSGLFFCLYGVYVTMPIGWCVYYAEHVTLAPVYDTLMLPVDFCCHDKYLENERRRAEELSRKRKQDEEQLRRNEEVRQALEQEYSLHPWKRKLDRLLNERNRCEKVISDNSSVRVARAVKEDAAKLERWIGIRKLAEQGLATNSVSECDALISSCRARIVAHAVEADAGDKILSSTQKRLAEIDLQIKEVEDERDAFEAKYGHPTF